MIHDIISYGHIQRTIVKDQVLQRSQRQLALPEPEQEQFCRGLPISDSLLAASIMPWLPHQTSPGDILTTS